MVTTLAAPLVVITDDNAVVDVEQASDGRFGPDPQEQTCRQAGPSPPRASARPPPRRARRRPWGSTTVRTPPSPASRHPARCRPCSHQARLQRHRTRPVTEARLPERGHTDREAELVAVIGERAYRIDEDDSLPYVSGPAVGQDISERITRLTGPAPQFASARPSRGSPGCGRTR
ncbi:fumarylacetoacetate hydrolase family protein [Streptomyces sp. NPDC000618]|uniref:fumarylacetoacetate hydrolase family protein n=1 Tax=Streptomyces sp. NPDC000618 TaxID=3154265 RepID=UPI003321BA81